MPGNGKPWVGLLPALPVVDGVQDLSAYDISDYSGQLKLTEATWIAKSFQKGPDSRWTFCIWIQTSILWLVPLYAQQNDKTRRPMEGDDHKEIEVGFLEGQNQWIFFDKSDIRLQDISWDVIHNPKSLSIF